MFFKSELQRTLDNADALSASDKTKVHNYISDKINEQDWYNQFYDNSSLHKEMLLRAKSDRQSAISSLGEKDPDWVKFALWESWLLSDKNSKKIEAWLYNNIK